MRYGSSPYVSWFLPHKGWRIILITGLLRRQKSLVYQTGSASLVRNWKRITSKLYTSGMKSRSQKWMSPNKMVIRLTSNWVQYAFRILSPLYSCYATKQLKILMNLFLVSYSWNSCSVATSWGKDLGSSRDLTLLWRNDSTPSQQSRRLFSASTVTFFAANNSSELLDSAINFNNTW